jgi:hypothetical protein
LSDFLSTATWILSAILALWLLLEGIVRLYLEWPLETSFYGSLGRDRVRARQAEHGVRVVDGTGWAHLASASATASSGARAATARGANVDARASDRFCTAARRARSA